MRALFLPILQTLLVPTSLLAPTTRVGGRVTSQLAEPLPGVHVTQQGTFNTTTTDNGRYELSIDAAHAVIADGLLGSAVLREAAVQALTVATG